MNNVRFIFWIIALTAYPVFAKDYFVAPAGVGSNKGTGTIEQPFGSLTKAVNQLQAGDTLYLRGGVYHQKFVLNKKFGTADNPIVIRNYNEEYVEFNGTVGLKDKWLRHQDQVYKQKVSQPMWQLFVDGKDLTVARWPNGNWHDGTVWNKQNSMIWPEKQGSQFGRYTNQELSEFDQDLTGAVMVVNSGSFRTYQTKVTKHQGSVINYDTTGVSEHFSYKGKPHKHGYFLESKLALLDVPGEWYYDPKSSVVYVWLPDGADPNTKQVSGKVQSYAAIINKSKHIDISGINFFATTVKVKQSQFVKLNHVNFTYPSFSKRSLGDTSPIDVTQFIATKPSTHSYNQITNCSISYADGPAVEMTGKGNTIENCLIHDIDYSCTYKGGFTLNMNKTVDLLFRRNTVHTTGCSELFKAGKTSVVELNDLSSSGYMLNDGSMIQVSVSAQTDAKVRYNWVHDSVKQGIRFDNMNIPNSPWGKNGQVYNNVAWNTDRIFFKGDEHFIFNNVSFDSKQNDLIISSNTAIQGHNHKTVTRNNVTNKFSGHRTKPGKQYPVPGTVDNNWAGDDKGQNVRVVLRDPDNLDFRPKHESVLIDAGQVIPGKSPSFIGKSPDIGAYEYGAKDYWIPGFQSLTASRPVPPSDAIDVKRDADLMWLKGLKAKNHMLYFDDNYHSVERATQSDKAYRGVFEHNIFTPHNLKAGNTYYWRVDTLTHNGIVKGSVWSFATE